MAQQAPPPPRNVATEPPGLHFIYTNTDNSLLPLAANANASPQILIANKKFKGYFLTCISTGAFLCRIQVGDNYLSNAPIHSSNLFGTGQSPMPIIVPLKLKPNDVVTLYITDLSGANNSIYPAIHGVQGEEEAE